MSLHRMFLFLNRNHWFTIVINPNYITFFNSYFPYMCCFAAARMLPNV